MERSFIRHSRLFERLLGIFHRQSRACFPHTLIGCQRLGSRLVLVADARILRLTIAQDIGCLLHVQTQRCLFERQAIARRSQFRFRLAQFGAQSAHIRRIRTFFETRQRRACGFESRLRRTSGSRGDSIAHLAQMCPGTCQHRLGALNIGRRRRTSQQFILRLCC
jgi:hypothetical protein